MSEQKPETVSEVIVGQSASTAGLERIVEDVLSEWQMCGMEPGTLYGDMAIEVAKRAVQAEREACADIAEDFEDDMGHGKAQKIADAIRMRSND